MMRKTLFFFTCVVVIYHGTNQAMEDKGKDDAANFSETTGSLGPEEKAIAFELKKRERQIEGHKMRILRDGSIRYMLNHLEKEMQAALMHLAKENVRHQKKHTLNETLSDPNSKLSSLISARSRLIDIESKETLAILQVRRTHAEERHNELLSEQNQQFGQIAAALMAIDDSIRKIYGVKEQA